MLFFSLTGFSNYYVLDRLSCFVCELISAGKDSLYKLAGVMSFLAAMLFVLESEIIDYWRRLLGPFRDSSTNYFTTICVPAAYISWLLHETKMLFLLLKADRPIIL